jgi:hypothetical protein
MSTSLIICISIFIYNLIIVVIMLATSNRKQVLIAFDQMINARLGGWPDETFSARCWRLRNIKKYAILVKIIDSIFFWQESHCYGSYLQEVERSHLPIEYRFLNLDN